MTRMDTLSEPYPGGEEAAFAYLESSIWAHGPVCPHCGAVDRIKKIKARVESRVRIGLWRCNRCNRQFTVKVGTVFEHSRVPIGKIAQGIDLVLNSAGDVTPLQLRLALGLTYGAAHQLHKRIMSAIGSGLLGMRSRHAVNTRSTVAEAHGCSTMTFDSGRPPPDRHPAPSPSA